MGKRLAHDNALGQGANVPVEQRDALLRHAPAAYQGGRVQIERLVAALLVGTELLIRALLVRVIEQLRQRLVAHGSPFKKGPRNLGSPYCPYGSSG